ncbi:ATP-binding cassette domain-containing protein [uncultured Lactobacillus sp.]|uniref:ATP-binding cassette domain-containing protein n=1 Tax=uncultured Lactobacillus sp. TaxID=153152 RepID=UPI00345B10FE
MTQQFDGRTVLHDVTLRIGGSDCLILHGPNGGGKTTLLRLIAGLQSPAAGTVTRAAGLRIGYLPQARSIDRQFPITVGQVVSSGLAGRRPWQSLPRRPRNPARRSQRPGSGPGKTL